MKSAAEQAQVNVELIAPAAGGVDDSDGNHAPADQKIDGGPSVLYDAVILLASKHGASALAAQPAARGASLAPTFWKTRWALPPRISAASSGR